jgi:acetoacetyl-CoA synthetase
MAVETFSASGQLNPPGEAGELVCLQPFPCEPIGFWPLPGFGDDLAVEAAKARFNQAYFAEFKGVWCTLSHRCHEEVELTRPFFQITVTTC